MFLRLALLAVFAASLESGMGADMMGSMMGGTSHVHEMDMVDIHSHHRCCAHDMWTGMMYVTEVMLKSGETTPSVNQRTIMMDYDYTRKMEKSNVTTHDVLNDKWSNVVVWMDYNTMMQYVWMDGKCYPSATNGTMNSPCIPSDFNYGGSMMIGSGDDTIRAHNWMGMENGIETSISVTEGDCTPLTMQVIGMTPDGTNIMEDYLFSEVKQGQLSMENVFDMPAECMNAPATSTGQ